MTDRRRWLRIGAVLFITAGLVFLGLLAREEWGRLQELTASLARERWSVQPWLLGLALATAVANLGAMASVWVYLYRQSGGTVEYPDGWAIWSATNIGRYIPGKLWHLTGLTVYLKERGESGAAGLVSSLAFQVLVLVTGAATTGAVLLGTPVALSGGSPLRVVAVLAGLAVLLHPAVLRKGTRWAARLTREDAAEIHRIRGGTLLAAALALVVTWLAYGLSFWLMVQGLLPDIPLGLLAATGVFAASYVLGYLAFLSPGGLVVREGAMVGLLAALGVTAAAPAGLLAVAYRLCLTVAELIFLGLTFGARALGPSR